MRMRRPLDIRQIPLRPGCSSVSIRQAACSRYRPTATTPAQPMSIRTQRHQPSAIVEDEISQTDWSRASRHSRRLLSRSVASCVNPSVATLVRDRFHVLRCALRTRIVFLKLCDSDGLHPDRSRSHTMSVAPDGTGDGAVPAGNRRIRNG